MFAAGCSPVFPMSSTLVPTSTPLRGSSKKISSDHHTPPATFQSDLQESLSQEIHDHTWEFDAERIAKMLSATSEGPPDALVDSAHQVLGKNTPLVWPTADDEILWYSPLAVFLNNYLEACHKVLDEHHKSAERSSRFYSRLNFIAYGRTTYDGVEGASPVKPDLVGGLDLEPGRRVAWSPPDTSMDQVLIPVEVKANWAPMVIQAATYARCLFSASPSRQFSVVLGFRHTEAQLRFLVFHRSGLTGSKPCSVEDPRGQKDILRIFLSILQWTSTNDAGFLEFFNDFDMTLIRNKGDKTGTVARVAEVLHDGLCVRGRASRVLQMVYPTGEEKKSEPPISTLDPTARTCGRPGTKRQTEQGAGRETKTSQSQGGMKTRSQTRKAAGQETEQEAKTSQSQGGMKTRSQTRKATGQESNQEAKTSPLDQTTRSHGDPKTKSQKKQGAKQGNDKISMSLTSSTYRWPSDM